MEGTDRRELYLNIFTQKCAFTSINTGGECSPPLERFNSLLSLTILDIHKMDYTSFLYWSTSLFCAALYIGNVNGELV